MFGPMMKLWNAARACVAAIMIGAFAYGWVHYPDAPLRACPEHGYCGKQGQPHTADDYTGFMDWVRVLIVVWPLGAAAMILLQRYKPKA